MAEQTYDLTQEGADVQAIINDANNMKGAGAQTTLTDESVLLKDTNGQYHKILKSSFTEAIRDTLAGLLVNNDKGTNINQIAAIASGDFGSVTPANLASVLGGQRNLARGVFSAFQGNLSAGSINRCYTEDYGGWWLINPSTVTDLPDQSSWHMLLVTGWNETMANILLSLKTNDKGFYYRVYHNSEWESWKKVCTAD